MNLTTKECQRAAVLQLYLSGHRLCDIFKALEKSGMKRRTVYDIVHRYLDTGSVSDRKRSGRPRTVRTPAMLKALTARIRRSPRRSQKKLALQIMVSKETIRKALREDLGVKAFKRGTCHMLTIPQKKMRVLKCRALIKRYAGQRYRKILFTDEKIFTTEEKFNAQNDRIYAKSKSDIPIASRKSKRSHHPGSVMVWIGVSWTGKSQLFFVPQGVKVQAKNYLESNLKPIVKPLGTTLFNDDHWTLQQDSAPSHKAKIVQDWLRTSVPDFVSAEEWPSASPDLNPLDYDLCSKLEMIACSKPHTSVEALKKSILKAWDSFPMEAARAAIDRWPARLRECVKAK